MTGWRSFFRILVIVDITLRVMRPHAEREDYDSNLVDAIGGRTK